MAEEFQSSVVWCRIAEELLPTPARSHYTFNLRDLSKQFQGLLMVTPSTCPDKEALARLWIHEACRVFADRLVSDEDREYFEKMLVGIVMLLWIRWIDGGLYAE